MRTINRVSRAVLLIVPLCAGVASGQRSQLGDASASNSCNLQQTLFAHRSAEKCGGGAESLAKSNAAEDIMPWNVRSAEASPILIAQNSAVERAAADEHRAGTLRPSAKLPSAIGATPADVGKAAQKSQLDPNAYIIGEQDSLTITVWKEKELSGTVVVRPDGKITVPLVGEVNVVGMTPVQVQTLLAEKLKPFVTIPQVTVAVNEIRSRKVYLIGHTAKEGSFTINSSTTVLQIIAQAGGLKDFAKRKKIYVLRQQGADQVHLPFNYDEVIKGRKKEQNILLQPGDTIVVP